MSPPPDHWLSEALATRDLERVSSNMPAAGERINDARRHVTSARLLAEDDPTLAVAILECHEADGPSAAQGNEEPSAAPLQ